MLGRLADLPAVVQEWILSYFPSEAAADQWLRRRDPAFGCTPLQLLDHPPGLSRLPEMLHERVDAEPAEPAPPVTKPSRNGAPNRHTPSPR